MTAADRSEDRSREVCLWLRRPFWWGGAVLVLMGTFFLGDISYAREEDRTFDRGYPAAGTITDDLDDERVQIIYFDPRTGEEVRTSTAVWNPNLLPDSAVGPIALTVSPDDPKRVVIAGDRFPVTFNLPLYAACVMPFFLVWATRLWTARRNENLVASDTVAYAMRANARPAFWGRRGRLDLYALDAEPSAKPVCTVPLVSRPSTSGLQNVEVKGPPRPYARVVARTGDMEVLWPSGRALATTRRSTR